MNLHKPAYLTRLAFVLFIVFAAQILRGQTIYTGPPNGDWATAANWNNGTPSAANLPTVTGGSIVNINGTLTIDYAVTNFGTIINKGTTTLTGSINSGGALENQGTLTIISAATMTSSGGFTNSGTLNNSGNVNSNSAFTNTVTGVFNNFSTWSQGGTTINDGIMSNKAGTFSCPSGLTNNKTVENLAGATWKVDFGGSYTNATGSTLTNAGSFQNLSTFTNTTTVTNTGIFTNNGTHICNGIFNNENGGRFESTAIVNLAGTWNNKVGATTQSGFRFNILANGIFNNNATFQNNDQISIALNGTFNSETGSIINLNFGSSILNGGTFTLKTGAIINSNGTITNAKICNILGTIESSNGAQISNSDQLNIGVGGLVRTVSIVTNSSVFTIDGTLEINSGGAVTNTGNLTVNKTGKISNNEAINNQTGATLTNNGTIFNAVLISNTGIFVNNAYLNLAGDLKNLVGGVFNNTEVVEIRDGALVNSGSVTNSKSIVVRACGIISNTSTISNNGSIENGGVIFQRGTVTGNAIVTTTGYLQTSPTSIAPSICKPTVLTGTDLLGKAKVDAPAVVAKGFGIDSCFGVQYFIEYVNRRTYDCSNIGQTITAPVTLRFRTNDSLTCTTLVTVFDGIAPVISNCPQDVTILNRTNTTPYSWSTIAATDNCLGAVTITSTIASGSVFNAGTTEVVVTAKDASNNASDCRFKVTVQQVNSTATCPVPDVTAPVFAACPANIVLNSVTGVAAASWNTPSVSDACYPVYVRVSNPSGSFFPTGTTAVTYTATDASNNVSTCSFTVTVNGPSDFCATDNIKPIIRNCPPNFFGVSNAAINGAVSIWLTPSVSDNCGLPTLTATAKSGDIFPNGTTAVTYTATDAKGNVSACTFNVLVGVDPCPGDVTAPALTCPADVSFTTTGQTAIATWVAPTPTDACGGITLVSTHTSGSSFVVGETFVTYQASDKKGNKSSCVFKVTVANTCFTDVTVPVINACPANIAVQTATTSATATWTAPTATDNCSNPTLTSTHVSGATFPLGATTVTYTATDNNGNKATCIFTVTVTLQVITGGNCTGGLKGSYFNNKTLTGTPALVRTDATVDFDWTSGSPAPVINADNFSIRWDGQIEAPVSGIHTFTTTSDDGIRLWVNNVLVIDKWIDQAPTQWSGTINLTAGQKYAIKIEYYENGGGAVAKLNWSYAGQAVQIVPTSRLCSTPDVVAFDPTKCYKIVNKTTGKVLDVEASNTANFARIFQWTLHGGPNQQWQLTKLANGLYEIKSRVSNKLLDIVGTGGNCANGVATEQYIDDNTTSQEWNLIQQTDGSYKLKNGTCNTKTLRVENGSTLNGAKVELWDDTGAEYFKWFIVETPCTTPLCTTNGGLIHERWTNRTPTWVSPIVLPTTAPNTVIMTTPSDFKSPSINSADNYISRVRGYIKPSVSGNYTFNVTGDDFTELWLSTDNRSANISKIAHHYGYTGLTEYTKYTTQTSVTKTLQAGQLYYVELRHMEGGGGDFYQVQWKTPSNTNWAIIPSANLAMPCSSTQQTALSHDVFSFEAKADFSKAQLQWVSNTGYKTDYFMVERINKIGIFETLEIVNAYTGNDALKSYNHLDINPLEGDNYYRITTMNLDGTPPQYSEVKKLLFGKITDINLFPNPADDYIDIDLRPYEGKAVTVYFYNTLGKMLKKVTIEHASAAPQRIVVDNLNSGSYLIRVQTEGKRDVLKQVKIAK